MITKIRIKPHHLVDIICSFGKGERKFKPHAYGHAVHSISEYLLKNPLCQIQIELGADDICAPCKHNMGGKCVDVIDNSWRPLAPKSKIEWNFLIDKRWSAALRINQNDVMVLPEFCKLATYNLDKMNSIYQELPLNIILQKKTVLKNGLNFIQEIIK